MIIIADDMKPSMRMNVPDASSGSTMIWVNQNDEPI